MISIFQGIGNGVSQDATTKQLSLHSPDVSESGFIGAEVVLGGIEPER